MSTGIIAAITLVVIILCPADQWKVGVSQDAAAIVTALIFCTSGLISVIRERREAARS